MQFLKALRNVLIWALIVVGAGTITRVFGIGELAVYTAEAIGPWPFILAILGGVVWLANRQGGGNV